MVKIKEIKISVHRKYTKDYNSYGFRIGMMADIGEDPDVSYAQISKVMEKWTKAEDNKIFRLIATADAKKASENIKIAHVDKPIEEMTIKVTSPIRPATKDYYSGDILEAQEEKRKYKINEASCTGCGGFITWDEKFKGKFPLHVQANGTIKGNGGCPKYA